jgi:glycosylphosphatidylinositol transamidase (GPIT) subunit GPI8
MREKKRYNEMLFMIDTCQANTLYRQFYAPGVIATGSSEEDESSYSHHADNDVGVAVIDRWTYYVLEFLETQVTGPNSDKTLGDLFDSYDVGKIHSNPGVRWDLFPGGEQAGRSRRVVDFFGNVRSVEIQGNKSGVELLKDDLEGLKRLVQEYQAFANAQESNQTEMSDLLRQRSPQRDTSEDTLSRHQSIAGKMKLSENTQWARQVAGVTVLSGLAALWYFAPKLV